MRYFIEKLRCLTRQKPTLLWRDERAAVAVLTAVFLTAFIAFAGAAVDLGILYSARNQLQNTADAAALAGASTMVVSNAAGEAQANYAGAEAEAIEFTQANKMLGDPLIWQTGVDLFEAGLWDHDLDNFTSTGPTADPNDLTAARVTLTRDVETFFARVVGIATVTLSADATAFLGWAGNTPAGEVDLPIALHQDALDDCGQIIRYNSNNTETASWTSFFLPNANNPNISQYITGEEPCPALQVGDDITLNNGVIASLFETLNGRYIQERDGNGEWRVLIPVVDDYSSTNGAVVGFVHFVITEILGPPDKSLSGYMDCQAMIVPDSNNGGADYGTRAGIPSLTN